MNAEELKRMAAVMLAAAEGKKIQFSVKGGSGVWRTTPEQLWDWSTYDYRVKPETIRYRVALIRNTSALYSSVRFYPTAVLYEEQQCDDREKCDSFVRGLTDWQEVEV